MTKQNRITPIFGELGFSLSEILIVIIVGAIATATLVQIGILVYTTVENVKYRAAVIELNENLLTIISDPKLCKQTFNFPVNVSEIQSQAGMPVQMTLPPPYTLDQPLRAGTVITANQIVVRDLRLTNGVSLGRDDRSKNTYYSALLETQYSPLSSNGTTDPSLTAQGIVGGAKRKVGSVSLELNQANTIVSCTRSDSKVDPVAYCGSLMPPKVYFGKPGQSFGQSGHTDTVDPNGCVDASVLIGHKGDDGIQGPRGDDGNLGPPGPTGWQGPTGAPGPNGDVGPDIPVYVPVYIPNPVPVPVPSSPKFSDVRTKSSVAKFGEMSPDELRRVDSDIVSMTLIKTIQDQQKQIDELRTRFGAVQSTQSATKAKPRK